MNKNTLISETRLVNALGEPTQPTVDPQVAHLGNCVGFYLLTSSHGWTQKQILEYFNLKITRQTLSKFIELGRSLSPFFDFTDFSAYYQDTFNYDL